MHVRTSILALLCLPGMLLAQLPFQFQQTDTIPVFSFRSKPVPQAWTGGMNQILYMHMDLNLDQVDDLLLFDRTGFRWLPFLYTHTPGGLLYTYAPEYLLSLPEVAEWALTEDLDRDGAMDLFTYQDEGMVVYRNVSADSGRLAFAPLHNLQPLQSQYSGGTAKIEITSKDLPSIIDMDDDGDVDLVFFTPAGAFVHYHRNRQVESALPADSLDFVLESACWGQFEESDFSADLMLNVSCKGNSATSGGGRHAGSTLAILDLDGDQDKDALVGDIFTDYLIYLQNGTASPTAFIDSQINDFPSSFPINMETFPAASICDIDHDGLDDIMVSPFTNVNGLDRSSSWYFRNSGTAQAPDWAFIGNAFLQEDMIDVGTRAYPKIVDYNLDGLPDLMVTNLGVYTTFDTVYRYYPSISLYRNRGTATQPSFWLETDDMAELYGEIIYQGGIQADLADLDGDTDLDLMVGRGNGVLDIYENISSSSGAFNPLFDLSQSAFQGIDVGANAAPLFVDVNHDGLQDLLVGNRQGSIHYYENTSTPGNIQFTGVTTEFAGVQTTNPLTNTGFNVVAWHEDESGAYLFVGTGEGQLLVYTDIDTLSYTTARLVDSLENQFRMGTHYAPTIGDLNADSIPDMILGNASGGLSLYMGIDTIDSIVSIAPEAALTNVQVYPNPASDQVVVVWENSASQSGSLMLWGMQGQLIQEQRIESGRTTLDISMLVPGVYLLELTAWKGISFYTKLHVYR